MFLKKLFKTNIKIHKVFTTQENIEFINEHCKKIDFPIYTASNELMKKIVGHKIHQGMMALIDKPNYIEFEEIVGNVVVLNGFTFSKKSAIIIGSEGNGVEKDILNLSDTILKIDIDEEVTSLNASIAAAIILYAMKEVQ
ncbi:MAG TPA: hypothetical protein EYG93_05560 [Sulfurospirillum arcachonense]|nr:hypothetical protein [Sulfurospirillum arcachonense]HIP44781.1 hypothetical protein [Sulfurospirillum arcachonense]